MKKLFIAGLALAALVVCLNVSAFANDESRLNGYTFDVTFPVLTSDTTRGLDGATYRLYSCEGCQFTKEPGKPQIPVIRKFVAVPKDAQDIKFSVSGISGTKETLKEHIYPAPRPNLKNEGGRIYSDEQFDPDWVFYEGYKEFYPRGPAITESGNMRELRYIVFDLPLVQYRPVDKVLQTNKSMTVQMTWRSKTGKIGTDDMKEPFKGLITKMLNYPEAAADQKAPADKDLVIPGAVTYPGPADFANPSNQADYLIITADDFYASPSIANLAYHRATYNGFNVAVIKASDVYAAVPENIPFDPQLSDIGDNRDLKIKTLIKYAYEYWDQGTNALSYVLVVGDAYPETASYYLPIHETTFPGTTADGIAKNLISDYWYTTINDDNYSGMVDDLDFVGDLVIGRFSVQTAEELQSIIEKTIHYELYPPQYPVERWGSRVLLTSGFAQGNLVSHMPALRDLILPQHREVNEVDVRYTGTDAAARQAIKDHVNQVGHALWVHNGHGWSEGWRIGGEYSTFTSSDIGGLYNGTMLPVIFSLACSTGELDHPEHQSFGEQFVSAQDKGAIAFLGAMRVVSGGANNELVDEVTDAIFDAHDYVLGSSILQGKLNVSYTNRLIRHSQNLFGDPALDLSAVLGDYEVDKAELQCSLINFAAAANGIKFGARVKNSGLSDALHVPIQLYQNHPFQGGVAVPTLEPIYIDIPAQTEMDIFPEVPMNGGWMEGDPVDFYLTVDTTTYMEEASVDELCETNNVSGKIQFFAEPFGTSLVSPGSQPAIQGKKIVWIDNSSNQYEVFLYDLGRDNIFLTADDVGKFQVTSDGFSKAYPAIYGNRIIWRDSREGGSIRMYDLGFDGRFGTSDDGGESVIARNLYDLSLFARPKIYESTVVYHANRNSNWDIYSYNIKTGSELRITDENASQQYPSVHKNMIVWQDYRNGHWDIYLYDLVSGNERRISTGPAQEEYPVIYGNKIAWQDNRNDAGDIYAYDLGIDLEMQITSDPQKQSLPALFGTKLAWEDSRNENQNIYHYDFANPRKGEVQLTSNPAGDTVPQVFEDGMGAKYVYQNASKVFIINVLNRSPGGVSGQQ